MKCITLHQPLAWAVASGKLNMFPSMFLPKGRGWILVHSGSQYDLDYEDYLEKKLGIIVPSRLPSMSIVGAIYISGAITKPEDLPRGRKKGAIFAVKVADQKEFRIPNLLIGRRGFWPAPSIISRTADRLLPFGPRI